MPQGDTRGIGRPNQQTETLPSGISWFLGIGINEYEHFTPLHNAVKDVKDLMILLQDQYGLKPEHTITLFDADASRSKIINTFDGLADTIAPTDKLLIYYSGHGHLKRNGGFWIPQDAKKGEIASYITNENILRYINEINSLHTLLISDSCFAGSLLRRGAMRAEGDDSRDEREKSRWCLVSGRHNEQVYDGEPGTNSPFAASILKVLGRNQRDKLSIASLGVEVEELITPANSKQSPECAPLTSEHHEGGKYVFRLVGSETNLWERCRNAPSLASCNAYLDRYPHGAHAEEVLRQIRQLEEAQAWQEAERIDKVYAYQTFLRSFPRGDRSAEARARIRAMQEDNQHQQEQQIWERARAQDSTAGYREYLRSYPNGRYHTEASQRLRALEELEAEALREGRIQADWKRAQEQHSAAAYEVFMQRHPQHPLAASAQRQLAILQQPPPKQPPPSKPVEPPKLGNRLATNATQPSRSVFKNYSTWIIGMGAVLLITLGIWWSFSRPVFEEGYPKKNTVDLGGESYPVIQFQPDGLTWMAKNLSYQVDSSWCYDNDPANCNEYGRLYTWEAAKQACAALGDGWRLPTDEEWRTMAKQFGGADDDAWDGGKAAYKALLEGGSSGFSARLGGGRYSSGSFGVLGSNGHYWSATEGGSGSAWIYYFFGKYYEELGRDFDDKSWGFSCRCIQD